MLTVTTPAALVAANGPTVAVQPVIPIGANGEILGGAGGTVAIDQTTPGVTNRVAANLDQVAGTSIAQGHGTAAAAVRVELPTDGTGTVILATGGALIGKVGIDQTTPGTTNAVVATGNVASGAANSGNPLKIGAVFNTTTPTVTNGQAVDLQANSRGALLTALSDGTSAVGITSSGSVDNSAAANTLETRALSRKFNGTAWDRDRKPNNTKILPSAAATTNADFAKASAGDLWCISGFNAAASVRYLKLFNKATAPTVGTDTPVLVIALPVGSFNINLSGHYFATGIAFALTTGAALLDTGALTAADIVGLTLTFA